MSSLNTDKNVIIANQNEGDNDSDDCEKVLNGYVNSLIDLENKCHSNLFSEYSLHNFINNAFISNEHLISSRAIALSSNVDRWACAGNKHMIRKELVKRVALMECSLFPIDEVHIVVSSISIQFARLYSKQVKQIATRQSYRSSCVSTPITCSDDDISAAKGKFNIKDADKLPTPAAYNIGNAIAQKLMRDYYYDSYDLLKSVAINIDAISTVRTGGVSIALVMALVGVKPIWCFGTLQIIGFEMIPLTVLRHLRLNLLIRITSLLRNSGRLILTRLHKMFDIIAKFANEISGSVAQYGSIFCCKPGSYGTGIQELLDDCYLPSITKLIATYTLYGRYYFNGVTWCSKADRLIEALSNIQIVIHIQDNSKYGVLNSSGYYQYISGLVITARYYCKQVYAYHIDISYTNYIKIRIFEYKIAKIIDNILLNKDLMLIILSKGDKGIPAILVKLNCFCNFAIIILQSNISNALLIQDEAILELLFSCDCICYNILKYKYYVLLRKYLISNKLLSM